MNDVFVVETPTCTAGIAVRERAGLRFHAAHEAFRALDRRIFPRAAALHRAVDAAAPRRAAPRHARG